MSYTVRHQVFVSSTFTDLKDERAEVIQALWELDCIPTGMEAFVASNESQWEVIKRVIDECDYYVLILGGRYGSVTDDGISYTEKEYRYAKKIGLPVLAFAHSDPLQIPVGKSEDDTVRKAKLEAFRAEVLGEYPVKYWTSASELGGHVSRALIREIKINERPGWIRNDGNSPIALMERVSKLTEENENLRAHAAALSTSADEDSTLESGEDEITLDGLRSYSVGFSSQKDDWEAEVSWNDIFKDIGPALINEATEEALKAILSRFHSHTPINSLANNVRSVISLESWNEVLIQFRALGYIEPGSKKRGVSDKASYWRLTPRGDAQLVRLMARHREPIGSDLA